MRRSRLIAVLRRVAMTRGALPGADLGGVLVKRYVADPVEAVFYAPMPLHPCRQGGLWRRGKVGGGDDVHDLDGLGPGSGHGPADLGDLGRAGEPDLGGGWTTLMVRRTRRPWLPSSAVWEGTPAQGSFCRRRGARAGCP